MLREGSMRMFSSLTERKKRFERAKVNSRWFPAPEKGDGQNTDPQSMDYPNELPKWTNLKWTTPKNNIPNDCYFNVLSCQCNEITHNFRLCSTYTASSHHFD